MVNTGFLKKAAVCGAAVSVIGAAFFHHRIQGEKQSGNLVNTPKAVLAVGSDRRKTGTNCFLLD